MKVRSELGRGSSFYVYLPHSDAELTAPSINPLPGYARLRGHVLLVEDSDLVRGPIRRMLEALGLHVTEAAGGRQGISAYLAASEPIDLVLTDVVMCDQNGPSLAAALRAHGHPVPFLFMSGYAEDSFGEPEALGPDVNFISKPFTISALRSAVAQTLARHSNSPPQQ